MKDNDGSEQDNPELFGTEIDYHRYWKDMYEKEHKLRLEAEGETHLVKAVGMNSPEMKAANVKIDEMRKELDRIKLENNNLFTRVADSLEVNEYHQNLNSNLQVRIAKKPSQGSCKLFPGTCILALVKEGFKNEDACCLSLEACGLWLSELGA
jgi:hypothetical protein